MAEPLPGRVLAEGVADEQVWRELQRDLVARAPGSAHIIAEHSGHYIQLQQPELVVAAIQQITRTARAQWQ
jgi:pimeloyl-ACP methyl ester carboxylesterase